ncbi:MAG: protein kinase [Candidatus Thermoplasmatota archaeon]|jgi:HD superfamily phosphohydrolase|nr:protein kinase [Candidatus Thermoplasmatota archaeon]
MVPSPSDQDILNKDIALILDAISRKARLRKEVLYTFVSNDSGQPGKLEIRKKVVKLDAFPEIEFRKEGEIRHGGGGIIFQVWGTGILAKRQYAMKIARPSSFENLLDPVKHSIVDVNVLKTQFDSANQEAINSASLYHNNVLTLFSLSSIKLSLDDRAEFNIPISLYEWIPESLPIDTYIYKHSNSLSDVISLFRQVLRGLEHIHEQNLIHWDLKADNCLVISNENSSGPRVKIIDVGNSRPLSKETSTYDEIEIAFTSGNNLPNEFPYEIHKVKDHRAFVVLKKNYRTLDRPWLDLYMFGRMMGKILGFLDSPSENHEKQRIRTEFLKKMTKDWIVRDPRTKRTLGMLKIIYGRLVAPISGDLEGPSIKPEEDNDLRYYKNVRSLFEDLGKAIPEYGATKNIPELSAIPQKIIRLPISGNIEHSARIKYLIDSPPMKRLSNFLQLSHTYMAFPGARHTRFGHSLGTMGVVFQYIRALYSDDESPDFRLLCDDEDIQALIFASAVHDIGHTAFSHYLEEMDTLFRNCKHEDYAQAILRQDKNRYSGIVIDNDIQEMRKIASFWLGLDNGNESAESKNDRVTRFLTLAANILGKVPLPNPNTNLKDPLLSKSYSQFSKISTLHSIIDGPIDADKLDYVRRDSEHAGLEYAKSIDVNRFLQSLTTVSSSANPFGVGNNSYTDFLPTICVRPKGISPVESLLLARYQVYSTLYWHKTMRMATVLIQYLAWRFIYPKSISNLDPRGKLDEIKKRRSTLISIMRENTDHAALLKLRELLDEDGNKFDHIWDAILARQRLPVVQVKLNMRDFSTREENLASLFARHEYLVKHSSDELEYCEKREKIMEILCEKIQNFVRDHTETIGKENVEKINKTIDETRVFLDIPIGSKDQVDNLWVLRSGPLSSIDNFQTRLDSFKEGGEKQIDGNNEIGPSEVENSWPSDFKEESPMISAIRDGFALWGRKMRIFLDVGVFNILNSYPDLEKDINKTVYDSLVEAYDKVLKVNNTEVENKVRWFKTFKDRTRKNGKETVRN